MLKLLAGFAIVTFVMWGIFNAAEWYAGNTTLPRYCDDPAAAVGRVEEIMTSPEPAGNDSRRDYVIAAKLVFLVPRADDESLTDYKHRLHRRISETCR